MVSPNLIPFEFSSFLKSESSKLSNSLGIDKINTIPALIGFTLGGIFIIIHWLLQQVFLLPKRIIRSINANLRREGI